VTEIHGGCKVLGPVLDVQKWSEKCGFGADRCCRLRRPLDRRGLPQLLDHFDEPGGNRPRSNRPERRRDPWPSQSSWAAVVIFQPVGSRWRPRRAPEGCQCQDTTVHSHSACLRSTVSHFSGGASVTARKEPHRPAQEALARAREIVPWSSKTDVRLVVDVGGWQEHRPFGCAPLRPSGRHVSRDLRLGYSCRDRTLSCSALQTKGVRDEPVRVVFWMKGAEQSSSDFGRGIPNSTISARNAAASTRSPG